MKMWVIEMNNQVVFAAAGHGKTYSLCSQAKTAIDNTNKHVLLISYTNEGMSTGSKTAVCWMTESYSNLGTALFSLNL